MAPAGYILTLLSKCCQGCCLERESAYGEEPAGRWLTEHWTRSQHSRHCRRLSCCAPHARLPLSKHDLTWDTENWREDQRQRPGGRATGNKRPQPPADGRPRTGTTPRAVKEACCCRPFTLHFCPQSHGRPSARCPEPSGSPQPVTEQPGGLPPREEGEDPTLPWQDTSSQGRRGGPGSAGQTPRGPGPFPGTGSRADGPDGILSSKAPRNSARDAARASSPPLLRGTIIRTAQWHEDQPTDNAVQVEKGHKGVCKGQKRGGSWVVLKSPFT